MTHHHTAVRFVDAFMDNDPKTRDTCPGTVNGHKLIKIALQKERRIFKKIIRPIKHIIYREEGTRSIWYKQSECNAGVVMMGFSMKEMDWDRKAVPMETYAKYFIDIIDADWLARNDYVLT